jgi:transcriptional regulator with XRE-family HTH domain
MVVIMSIYGMSDTAIMKEIGYRLRRRRLEKNFSQQKLATLAGLSRTAIVNVEKGAPFGILTLIQIMRALDALEEIDSFLPEPGISPLELAKLKGKERRRASKQTAASRKGNNDW